ncbi:FMN-dependent NADH-azoreductase [Salidesulfovibrio brasiliensis]|uniref:FMN-dependent NADH-azoreductase n=1 Tax=Salidesulfovibrio brasiliensis TaxID=221711 RepID=UPI0006D0E658|nr:NAD(P)H-dependent oxidoreductase [Salidesulfovibrio brasiliensis]
MTKLLYVKGSPRTQRSHSIEVANAFVKECIRINPDIEVLERDLGTMELPELDEKTLNGKYNIMHGRDFSEEDRQAWAKVEAVIEDFKAADKYLFAVPMWNFNVPYRLKHYMDVIAQPTYTFTASPEGYNGLVEGKACVIYARGGNYPVDSAINFQGPYFHFYLNFIGITDITTIEVQPTIAGGPEGLASAKRKALAEATEFAQSF